MQERELRGMIEEVRDGRLPRRSFIQHLVSLGLTAPMATMMLAHSGIAMAQTASTYKPTKRGGGGALKLLWWQGATLLNPHFAVGTKDQEGSRVFYEPLAGWDPEGNLFPVLAAEVPSRENGGVAADGKSVIWKLKRGVTWHDGAPFTADDCVFNWEYAKDPATAAVSIGSYKDVTVEKIDSHTVNVIFSKPTPFWADAFVGTRGMLIPKHLFGPFAGGKSRDAPNNLKPVGTGPYKFADFKPGDMVRGTINTSYHMANRPYFDAIEMKGGGDAASAARAVLQTGEYVYAWNLQVEDEVLKKMEAGGKGKVSITEGGNIEFIQLNLADPNTEVDGERASPKSKHPVFSERAVRDAMAMLIDRKSVQDFIYGRAGIATGNFLNAPPRFRSPNTKWEFNVDKAAAALEAAGWKKGQRRHPREGRQETQVRVPDLDQRPAPKHPGHHQAGLPEGRRRPRAQVRHRVGVLLVRRGQSRYVRQVLVRHADVHHHHDAARRRAVHGPVHLRGGLEQGQQMAGSQYHALDQCGVRQAVQGRAERTRSGQAGNHVCPHERPGLQRPCRHSGGLAATCLGHQPQAQRTTVRMGQRLVEAAGLVPGNLIRG